eukprot:CAMPEP_0174279714 /NCGR_PEP_ID=MMETSP0439-20130205/62184_1 /TAXON_ID=0 /ORGANISM="Stereomyxa ramosa, Strain Chinc5" /LENGTH=67 /DNA_ID=CAMNT_0015372263 /DNA_START=1090 /DNA_END=1290 /DNA_ORIENTATION=+
MTLGIFRVSGVKDELVNMVKLLNNDEEIDFSILSLHSTASFLKRLLRELPEPLLKFENWEKIKAVLN